MRQEIENLLKANSYDVEDTGVHEDFFNKIVAAKSNLYAKFGNQLTLSKEVSIKKSEEQLAHEIDSMSLDTRLFKMLEKSTTKYPDTFITYVSSPLSLVKKTFQCDRVFEQEGCKTIKVSKGAKISKFINKLDGLDSYDKEYFVHKYSTVFNEATIKGNLCISIDPKEILTASINNYSWGSCYALDGGEYCASVIEYLFSSKSFIVYLSTREMSQYGATFADKKWRTWSSIGEKCFTLAKGYPYDNIDLNAAAAEFINEVFGDIYDLSDNHKGTTSIVMGEESYSDCAHWSFALKGEEEPDRRVVLDGYVCPCCGKSVKYLHRSFEIVCYDCSNMVYCHSCDGIVHARETQADRDGHLYCSHCFQEEVYRCSDCGGNVLGNTMREGVCRTCVENNYTFCYDCGGLIHDSKDERYEIKYGNHICYHCAKNHYHKCEKCDIYIANNSKTCRKCKEEN